MLPYYPPFLKQVNIKARQIILDVQDAQESGKDHEGETHK
jgi:hypothetical protein